MAEYRAFSPEHSQFTPIPNMKYIVEHQGSQMECVIIFSPFVDIAPCQLRENSSLYSMKSRAVPVRYPELSYFKGYSIVIHESMLEDFKVQFPHPCHEGLPGVFVDGDCKTGILAMEILQRGVQYLLSGWRIGFYRTHKDRRGYFNAFVRIQRTNLSIMQKFLRLMATNR